MLAPGQKFGPYELIAAIGEGGMGEVWKARDTRLGRTVAIKVSKASFSERFEREARAIASLSHPHICTLHDVGPDYLVMEYIEGKPVKGPIPVETALRYAQEIAAALDAAHRVGIVHRDLKPGNILVAKSGIKLLDFGLAKVTGAAAAAGDETVTRALTEEGIILGTLQYMAPEQLEGREADTRSDIFAFGCVLYEMLTGAPAFSGGSRASIIAAIMERRPKPLPGVPPALAGAIERCLAKDPDDRWQSARDLAGVLALAAPGVGPSSVSPAPKTARLKIALAALTALAIVAISAAIGLALHRPRQEFWSGQPLGGPSQASGPRVSPDGQTVAFQAVVDGQTQVAIMKPESGNWTVLTHQREYGSIGSIAWSRDGAKLYFDRSTDSLIGIFSVPSLGGEPRMVLEASAAPCVLADSSLVITRLNPQREYQLFRYWPESGKIAPLPAILDSADNIPVRTTADGKTIVFFGNPLDAKEVHRALGIYSLDPESGKLVNLAPGQPFRSGGVSLATSPDGRSVVYGSYGDGKTASVFAAPRDGSGEIRQLFTLTSSPQFLDVAPDGSIYTDQVFQPEVILRFPPGGGTPEQLATPQRGTLVLVLPDGRPLVYAVAGLQRRFQIVQPGGTLSPLIESNESTGPPAAIVGDRHVAVLSDRKPLEIAIVSIADGRIVRRVALKADSISSLAASLDGKTFYYSSAGFIWSMPDTGGEPRQLTPGDSVSADANRPDLIVSRQNPDGIVLVRVPMSGGAPQPIDLGGVHLTGIGLASSIVGPTGLLALQTTFSDQWIYQSGLLDPKTGKFKRFALNFAGEPGKPVWTRDGRIVSGGTAWNYTIWRFHATPR